MGSLDLIWIGSFSRHSMVYAGSDHSYVLFLYHSTFTSREGNWIYHDLAKYLPENLTSSQEQYIPSLIITDPNEIELPTLPTFSL